MGGSATTNTYCTYIRLPHHTLFIPMRKYAQLKTHLISKIVREGWWVLQRYYHRCCYIYRWYCFLFPYIHIHPTIYSLNMEGMWQPIKLALYACMHPITTPEKQALIHPEQFLLHFGCQLYKLYTIYWLL